MPYREPLFARLAARGRIVPRVIYRSAAQPGWDQPPDWYPAEHAYESEVLGSWQRSRPGRSPLMVARGLGAALARADPHCVVSWEYGPATWRALAWCRTHRRPLLIFSELTPWSDPALSRLQRRVHRALAPRVAGFVVAGSQGRERLVRLGVDPARIEVSLQSADLEPLEKVAERRAEALPLRVLAVGRLVPDKNLELLIRAFVSAGLDPAEAELELRGSGPLEHRLRDLAAQLGVRLRLAGYTSPADLPDAYRQAHVLALVSDYEPFGVTMREGAAAGLPLLCSLRAGAAGDVAVNDENALLVDPHDESAVARALARLVRDAELRRRLAAGSLAVTERHPLEADVEAFERAVLRVAG